MHYVFSVEAPIPSPEASRDAASVHGSVEPAVMDDSTERPFILFVEVLQVAAMEASTEAFTKAFEEAFEEVFFSMEIHFEGL